MNYQIIKDENKLQEFINWLPELLPNEQYYITLLARKKYNDKINLKQDKNQLKRVTATKDRIIQKLRQMECKFGNYTFEKEPIPQDNLCVYITPNPRDLHKSSYNLLAELARKLRDGDEIFNPQSLAFNVIQTTSSRKIYFDTDIDFKRGKENFKEDFEKFSYNIQHYVNHDALTCVKTNGGLHCLIELQRIKNEYSKSWYNKISKMGCEEYDVTMNSDNLIPIPGCVQGNDFTPYFISLEKIEINELS